MIELIIIDLNQDGVQITNESSVYATDISNGASSRLQWLGSDDAILYLDIDKSGTANEVKEYNFKERMKKDVALLNILNMFDSNNDQIVDTQDVFYNSLRIWTDINQNGISEAGENKSLADNKMVLYVDKRYYINDATFKYQVGDDLKDKSINYIKVGYSISLQFIK